MRAEIKANLTSLVNDELVGSTIECELDGEIFHRDASDDDKDCEWGDWQQANRSQWHGYDVEGRCRSKRNTKPVNCDQTKR